MNAKISILLLPLILALSSGEGSRILSQSPPGAGGGVWLRTPPESLEATIRGQVVFPREGVRRVADRYAGGGGAVHAVQEIPAVAFLEGAIPGYPFRLSGEVEMAQQDTSFVPALLVVPPGTTVRFPNMDPFFHNVFSYSSPQRFDLGRYPQGESKEVRFEEPGIVKVYCEVHESMRSAILVLENPFHAVVGEDGAFAIPGVPAGEYTLVVWHADHGMQEARLTVPSSGSVSVTVDFTR